MKYALKKYVNWGEQHIEEFPPQWVYLFDTDGMNSSWSGKFDKAILFDSYEEAERYVEQDSDILSDYEVKDVVIEGFTEKEIFKRRLEGE